MKLLDCDGRHVRRVIGFLHEYRRVEISTPDGDISLVGDSEIALENDEDQDEQTQTEVV